MNSKRLLTCGLVLAAICVVQVVAQDEDDEFATASEEVAAVETNVEATPTPEATPPPKPLSTATMLRAKSWTVEIAFAAAMVAYFMYGMYVRNGSYDEAAKTAKALSSVLRSNFTRVGGDKATGGASNTFATASSTEFELWATGRRYCKGALITLAMKPRMDIMGMLQGVLPGQFAQQLQATKQGVTAASNTEQDRVVIEVPLGDEVASFLLAAVPSKDFPQLQSDRTEVKFLLANAKPISTGDLGLGRSGSTYAVAGDHKDAARRVFPQGSKLASLLDRNPGALAELLITDFPAGLVDIAGAQSSDTPGSLPLATARMSSKVLRATFTVPGGSTYADFTPSAVEAVLEIVDTLGAAGKQLGETVAAVKQHRDAYESKLREAEAKLEREKAKKEREEAEKQAEKEKFAKMSREQQKEYLLEQQRKKQKEETRKRVKMVRA